MSFSIPVLRMCRALAYLIYAHAQICLANIFFFVTYGCIMITNETLVRQVKFATMIDCKYTCTGLENYWLPVKIYKHGDDANV
jgi:hypothetical protein